MRDFQSEAFEEYAKSLDLQDWMKVRVANIHSVVTAADVLSQNGVNLRKHGAQEEQISCPFHGKDNRPSARYYPANDDKPSHVWCWVCRERWDAIGLWKRFNSIDKFSEALFRIEQSFGIERPESGIKQEVVEDPMEEEVRRLFSACENRLREDKASFEMLPHLKLGSVLDQLHYSFDKGALALPAIRDNLLKVLDKIGQIVRASESNVTNR